MHPSVDRVPGGIPLGRSTRGGPRLAEYPHCETTGRVGTPTIHDAAIGFRKARDCTTPRRRLLRESASSLFAARWLARSTNFTFDWTLLITKAVLQIGQLGRSVNERPPATADR